MPSGVLSELMKNCPSRFKSDYACCFVLPTLWSVTVLVRCVVHIVRCAARRRTRRHVHAVRCAHATRDGRTHTHFSNLCEPQLPGKSAYSQASSQRSESVSLIPPVQYRTGGFLPGSAALILAHDARARREHLVRTRSALSRLRRLNRWRLRRPSLAAASTPAAAPPRCQCTRLLSCASVACAYHPYVKSSPTLACCVLPLPFGAPPPRCDCARCPGRA